jgi:hypothetical protein
MADILAKRFNERVKLAVSALNTLGLAMIIAGVIYPLVRDEGNDVNWLVMALSILFGLCLHMLGYLALGYLKPED